MADMIQKAPASFADLSKKYQQLSEQLEPLRVLIQFLSTSQVRIHRASIYSALGV